MALLELRRRAGQRELVVVEAPLDVEMGLHQMLIALALRADDGLVAVSTSPMKPSANGV